MTESEMLDELRRRIKSKYGTQRALAYKFDTPESYVSSILKGNHEPPAWMLYEFGFRRVVTYADAESKISS